MIQRIRKRSQNEKAFWYFGKKFLTFLSSSDFRNHAWDLLCIQMDVQRDNHQKGEDRDNISFHFKHIKSNNLQKDSLPPDDKTY